MAVVGDQVFGIEAIGRPEVFATCFGRLLDSYAIDAIDHEVALKGPRPVRGTARFTEPEAFLTALRASKRDASPSLGLGEDLRIAGAGVEGCALVAGDLVHLTAAPEVEA